MVDVRFKPARLFPLQAISQFYPNGVVQDKRKSRGGGGGRDLVNRVKQRQTLEEQPTLGEPDKKFSGYL